MLAVHVEANPEPIITWQHNGTEKTFDDRIQMFENGSIQISNCESGDSGTWTIFATTILGQKASKQMIVDCHPDKAAIEVNVIYIHVVSFHKLHVFFFSNLRNLKSQ